MSDEAISRAAAGDQLRDIPMFAELGADDRRAIVDAAQVIHVASGKAIIREGVIADEFFVMLSGEAIISVAVEGIEEAQEVGTVRSGSTFGELGALLDEPRMATVTADSHCRLLRLDKAALESLFTTRPRFAIAFSREMARRLKDALAFKTEMQANAMPERVVLEVPDLTRLRQYMVSYYATAVKHVLKHHRLIVDRRFPVYEAAFTLTAEEQRRWMDLFDTRQAATPFTYHTTVGTMVLMRVVGDVGVNFRNLMHLKSEMHFAPNHPMPAGSRYRLLSQVEDIVPLRDDRVALLCASRVLDDSGYRIRSYRDFFVILNLEPEYVEGLKAAKNFGHHETAEFHGLASREAQLGDSVDVGRVTIDVPEDMGSSYGKVSGDLNLVHTTPMAAKLFGHPRPFVQGLCTANYVLRYLASAHGVPEQLSITFARRVFVGQRIDLRFTRRRFEVSDSSGALLAFGDYALPAD